MSALVATLQSGASTASGTASATSGARSQSTRSACAISARARRTPSASALLEVSLRPAMSTRITSWPPRSMATSRTSLVVPGSSVTMATSDFASALSRLDFPAFGGPASATRKPSRMMRPRPTVSIAASISLASEPSESAKCAGNSPTSPSSEKSSWASISARASSRRSRQPSSCADNTPLRRAMACLRWPSVSASIRSPRPSTSVRSSLPFSKARRVNSPASASRTSGRAASARNRPRTTAGDPWTCSSAQSSPVKLCGAGNQATSPRSNTSPSMPTGARRRRLGSGSVPSICSTKGPEAGPESRITATPEGSAPEESATMVSPSRIGEPAG